MKYFLLILLCVACTKTDIDHKIFIISKGSHFANPLEYRRYDKDTLSMMIMFTESCIYDEEKQENPGWNKLGYWYDGIHPHQNGVTFVWRCINNKIVLGWYGWDDFNSPMETGWDGSQFGVIGSIELHKYYKIQIVKGKNIVFIFDSINFITNFDFDPDVLISPHFGGLETAPHKMIIIREVINE